MSTARTPKTATKTTQIHHFLPAYSYEQGKLIDQDEFLDQREATDAFSAAEAKYRDRLKDFEIVLVGSDSIETIMRTHGHYFAQQDLAPFSTESPFQAH